MMWLLFSLLTNEPIHYFKSKESCEAWKIVANEESIKFNSSDLYSFNERKIPMLECKPFKNVVIDKSQRVI